MIASLHFNTASYTATICWRTSARDNLAKLSVSPYQVFVIRRQRNLIALPLHMACAINSQFTGSHQIQSCSRHLPGLSFLPSLSALNWPRINSGIGAWLQGVASVLETVVNCWRKVSNVSNWQWPQKWIKIVKYYRCVNGLWFWLRVVSST